MEFNFLQSIPAIVPEIGLTVMAVIVLALDLYLPESRRRIIAIVTGVGLLFVAALYFLVFGPTLHPENAGLFWGGTMRHDVLAEIFKVMVLIAAAVTALLSIDVKGISRKGEFYLVIIVSSLGACLMSGAADLIMV